MNYEQAEKLYSQSIDILLMDSSNNKMLADFQDQIFNELKGRIIETTPVGGAEFIIFLLKKYRLNSKTLR